MVFYLALLPSLVDLRQVGVSEWAALVGILICVLVVIDMTWAVFAASARKLFRRPALRRATHKISAGLMAGAAGLFAFKS